jgi:Domain of unknown function (DUF4410)
MKPSYLLGVAAMTLAVLLGPSIDFANLVAFAQGTASSVPKGPVYVRDFFFDVQNLKPDQGLLGGRAGPVGRLLQGLKPSEDPAAKAQELAALLSNTIVDELNNAGIYASRLAPGAFTPSTGLLVGGEFLEVDEGNRMRRAMVGFGTGSEEVKVQVEVYDLARDPNTPFLVYGAGEEGRKGPGAVVFRNPYAAAARYVLSRRATEKDVVKLGTQIAADLVKISEQPRSDQTRSEGIEDGLGNARRRGSVSGTRLGADFALPEIHSCCARTGDCQGSAAYPVARRDQEWGQFVNTWIELKRRDGTIDALYRHWILEDHAFRRQPRWSVIRNVLHWVE